MKKYIVVIITAVLFILMLCGWKRVNHKNLDALTSISIYEDEETGVEYIVFHVGYGTGVCPRYNADGTLYISGEE